MAVPIFDQAVRRVSRFERRTGLEVARVMIPPHGLCSDEMLDAMLVPGIEALCRAPVWWNDWRPARRSRARWAMADISPSGAPIVGRHLFTQGHARDEVVLDLFFDQPAVLYGHHHDLVEGYQALATIAEWLAGFDGLTWGSCEWLARTNLMTRREGDLLQARAYTRRGVVALEPGISRVEFEIPEYDRSSLDVLACDGATFELETDGSHARASVPVSETTQTLEFRLMRNRVQPPIYRRSQSRAVVRRSVGELRDRMHPMVRRAGLARTLRSLEAAYLRRASARAIRRTRSSN